MTKEDGYVDIICKGYCGYYKGGKEELQCGGYLFLRENATPAELRSLGKTSVPDNAEIMRGAGSVTDRELRRLVCERCDFLIDGCDFRDNRSGPPCGGYIFIRSLGLYGHIVVNYDKAEN